jgi:drug/metabolite transporter (DMT)-like permease
MKLHREEIIGFLFVLGSAVCFSSKGVIIKLAYKEQVDALTFLMFRMLFAFPLFVAIAFFFRKKLPVNELNPKEYLIVLFLGVLGYYFSSLLDFYGLEYISAGLERLILFIYPTIVVLLSAIIYKKTISWKMYLSLGVTYFGILLAVYHNLQIADNEGAVKGMLLVFGSAFSFAYYLVLSDKLVHKFGSIAYTSLIMIASALGVFVHFFSVNEVGSLFNYSAKVYGMGVILAVFCTVIPAYLMTDGIKKIGSRNAAITSTMGPAWTIILAALVLGESIDAVQIIGTGLVAGGVLIISLSKK